MIDKRRARKLSTLRAGFISLSLGAVSNRTSRAIDVLSRRGRFTTVAGNALAINSLARGFAPPLCRFLQAGLVASSRKKKSRTHVTVETAVGYVAIVGSSKFVILPHASNPSREISSKMAPNISSWYFSHLQRHSARLLFFRLNI